MTADFEVPGLPTVNRPDPPLPAAKKIAMSGWFQMNRSTIIAWMSYPFSLEPQLSEWMREPFPYATLKRSS